MDNSTCANKQTNMATPEGFKHKEKKKKNELVTTELLLFSHLLFYVNVLQI
jgi:hypothetical protein